MPEHRRRRSHRRGARQEAGGHGQADQVYHRAPPARVRRGHRARPGARVPRSQGGHRVGHRQDSRGSRARHPGGGEHDRASLCRRYHPGARGLVQRHAHRVPRALRRDSPRRRPRPLHPQQRRRRSRARRGWRSKGAQPRPAARCPHPGGKDRRRRARAHRRHQPVRRGPQRRRGSPLAAVRAPLRRRSRSPQSRSARLRRPRLHRRRPRVPRRARLRARRARPVRVQERRDVTPCPRRGCAGRDAHPPRAVWVLPRDHRQRFGLRLRAAQDGVGVGETKDAGARDGPGELGEARGARLEGVRRVPARNERRRVAVIGAEGVEDGAPGALRRDSRRVAAAWDVGGVLAAHGRDPRVAIPG